MSDPVSFYQRLSEQTTLAGCASVFREAVHPFGFDTFACGEVDLDDLDLAVFTIIEWPERWRRLYISSGLVRRDPILDQIGVRRRAFTWSELQDDLTVSQLGREALALVREHGWREGLVAPVPRGGSRFGLMSLASESATLTATGKAHLCLLSEMLLSRVRSLAAPGQFAARPLGLSGRELECVDLVARGRSDPEIAAALGVSRSTAHEYVEKARARLKAATRAQMTARAVSLGILAGS